MAYKRYWLKITSHGVPVLGSLQHRKKAPSATNDGRWVDVTKGIGLCCIYQGPPPVANFVISSPTVGNMTSSWGAVPGATAYKLEMATNATFTAGLITVVDANVLTATQTGLTSGQVLFYRLSVTTPAGTSGFVYSQITVK